MRQQPDNTTALALIAGGLAIIVAVILIGQYVL